MDDLERVRVRLQVQAEMLAEAYAFIAQQNKYIQELEQQVREQERLIKGDSEPEREQAEVIN